MTIITKAHRANTIVPNNGYTNVSYTSDDADTIIKRYEDWKFSTYKDDDHLDELFDRYLTKILGVEYSELAITRTIHESILLYSFRFIKYFLEPWDDRIVLFSYDKDLDVSHTVLIIPLKYL